MRMSDITRRNLVRGAAVASAAAVATGVAGSQALALQSVDGASVAWDVEADVVVVGFGGAGTCAAIAAADEGADVVVLEKTDWCGGNTASAGGGWINPTDADGFYDYCLYVGERSRTPIDTDVLRAYADGCFGNNEWLTSLDPDVADKLKGSGAVDASKEGRDLLPGEDTIVKYHLVQDDDLHNGQRLMQFLEDCAYERDNIEVLWQTSGKRLVQAQDGSILGVVAEDDQGAQLNVKARRGVVLSCGGFQFDDELSRTFVKGQPLYGAGTPANTGDGLRMGMDVGAALNHMNCTNTGLGIKVDEYEYAFPIAMSIYGGVWVKQDGTRFIREGKYRLGLPIVDYADIATLDYPYIPFYMVFDETERLRAPLVQQDFGYYWLDYGPWSADNSVEVEKGWIQKADTIEELAAKLGVDPEGLAATVERWNGYVDAGEDLEFGRPMTSGDTATALRIENGPFYGVAIYPCIYGTTGGPKRNEKCEVVSAYGEVIPHLYSAGELGGYSGMFYIGGGAISECLVTGRIAGAQAAQAGSWEEA